MFDGIFVSDVFALTSASPALVVLQSGTTQNDRPV
jgi:hypothetical protein